jgi:hypothetical protein
MKRRFAISTTAIFGTFLLMSAASVSSAHADSIKGCTKASLKGSFGFYRTGETSVGPLAALGILVFDGNGNFVGSQSTTRGGAFTFDVPIGPATYVLNADCTGKGFASDGTEDFRIVVTNGGRGFYIFSERPGNAVYGVGRKIEGADDDD